MLPFLYVKETGFMGITFKDFGFYLIDEKYLKYLHDIDEEVRYDEYRNYDKKPFLGILVMMDSYTYFIPLTSAKTKHIRWKNVDKTHYLIYEIIDKKDRNPRDIVREYSDTKYLKILSALDIKKMVPVPEGVYEKKNFDQETDLKYKYLLQKEYSFCLKIRKGIIEKAENLYKQQKDTSVVFKYYCDFTKLEKACDEYEG